MLYVDYDECGIEQYMVTNEQGLCLIRTTDGAIASFVEKHSKGLPAGMFLVVGGDFGWRTNKKIFHHIRRRSY